MREDIIDFLTFKLIDTESIDFTVYQLILLLFALFFTGFILKFIRKIVTRKLPIEDQNKFISLFQFAKYIVYVLVIIFTLDASGVNMNVFLTASAALFVGIGFALQTFFQDIISGILMILDQSLHVGDII
ncbi:MAG: mechanosensitive ion channel, partial [Flavobacteriaceae bacterium]|nr:mechanosensitive ion channel [Flavobacteriaceae bacterium]